MERCYESVNGATPLTVFAIPDNEPALVDVLNKAQIPFVVGHPTDLLSRYIKAATLFGAENVVRITADCPFIPGADLQAMVSLHVNNGMDITTNVHPKRSYPDGSDIEIISTRMLHGINKMRPNDSDKEHCALPYIYRNWHKLQEWKYRALGVVQPIDYSHIKTSIDTPEDLARVEGMMTK